MKITGHKLCQFIIKKFVKNNINWPKEIKITKVLVSKRKDYSFWNNLNDITIPSTAWFLTPDGETFLALQGKRESLKDINKIKYKISEDKIGEDKNTCQKPKSVLQFIRSWEENLKKK